MNESEALVHRLCRETFLSMWSVANPQGKEPGKELCDVLVVCDPDVIIISVKEIEYRPTDDYSTGADRWRTRAIEHSSKQIYGAERLIDRLDAVKDQDGELWLYLPPKGRRRIHRIAVALGSKGEVSIWDGDLGKGFVHVLEEKSLDVLMRELDTVTDFVDFLRATEEFLEETQVVAEGLENLLGLYLHHGRAFPRDADFLYLTDDIWSGISAREEFRRRKEADQESYFWDRLIEHVIAEHDPDLTVSAGEYDTDNPPAEHVVRIMARENRFNRRILSKAFVEFHQARNIRSRIVPSPSGVLYVFLVQPRGYDRTLRRNELLGRMFIARGMNQEFKTVVGVATEEYVDNPGFSIDVASYHKPEWSAEDQATLEQMQEETGAFVSPRHSRFSEDEYPGGEA